MRLRVKLRAIKVPNLIPYNKSYLSSSDLCAKLQGQGLTINDVAKAKKELERCSYYRFKAYLFPFKDLGTKTYNTGSTFEQGYELYHFDSELRAYLFRIIRNLSAPTGIKRVLSRDISLVRTNPQHGTRQTDQVNRIYTNICAIQKIYTGLGHEEKLGPALAHLFEKYPTAKRFRESMGFPVQWHQEPLLFNLIF